LHLSGEERIKFLFIELCHYPEAAPVEKEVELFVVLLRFLGLRRWRFDWHAVDFSGVDGFGRITTLSLVLRRINLLIGYLT